MLKIWVKRAVYIMIVILPAWCLLYPQAAQRWNKGKTTKVVEGYDEAISSLSDAETGMLFGMRKYLFLI